ncbi:MAG: hypothetical protein IJ126_08270 [Lachnospiraceae bacterium]|nr:hypothetical protein [Lachnospiraceae bacterium]
MKRVQILTKAAEVVTGKDSQHGDTEDNFSRIAAMWSAYLDKDVSAKDVAVMMILLKTARIASGHQSGDNWVDISGYAACGGEIEESMKEGTA